MKALYFIPKIVFDLYGHEYFKFHYGKMFCSTFVVMNNRIIKDREGRLEQDLSSQELKEKINNFDGVIYVEDTV